MSHNALAKVNRIVFLLFVPLAMLACAISSSPVSLPSTPTPSITATPTTCFGPYTWAYGGVSSEFIDQVQGAMSTAGIKGTVQASTFGENNGDCGYGAMAVEYVFTVQVSNLQAGEELANTGSTVLEIAKRFVDQSPAPNLGGLRLIFQANDQQCQWSYGDDAWNAGTMPDANSIVCPAPTSPESQRLADMLTALSSDLACEKFSVTTNTRQSALDCERHEAQNLYLVTITVRLNAQGYEGICFHGYKAFESKATGDTPMTVTDSSGSYFELDRNFQWRANGNLYELFERVKGGADVAMPPDTREKVFQRAVESGLISGEGSECQ